MRLRSSQTVCVFYNDHTRSRTDNIQFARIILVATFPVYCSLRLASSAVFYTVVSVKRYRFHRSYYSASLSEVTSSRPILVIICPPQGNFTRRIPLFFLCVFCLVCLLLAMCFVAFCRRVKQYFFLK